MASDKDDPPPRLRSSSPEKPARAFGKKKEMCNTQNETRKPIEQKMKRIGCVQTKKEKKTGKYLLQYGPGPKIMNHTPWAEQRSTKPMPKLQGSLEDLWRGTAITRVKELLLSLGEGTKAAKNYTPVLKQKRQNQPVLGIFKAGGGGHRNGTPDPWFFLLASPGVYK